MTFVPESVTAGVLLPASTLSSTWFQLLAAFVAFNTVMYIGLTLAKLTLWPRMVPAYEIKANVLRRLPRRPSSLVHPVPEIDTPDTDSLP